MLKLVMNSLDSVFLIERAFLLKISIMRGNLSIVHSNFSYSDILSLPYFENWLGGFTTAEGCFSIRASGRRRP